MDFTETLGRFARVLITGPFQLSESFTNAIQNGSLLFAFQTHFRRSRDVASQSIRLPGEYSNGQESSVQLLHRAADSGYRLSACRMSARAIAG